MRILLDESLPRGLKRLLQGFDIVTVRERGWQGNPEWKTPEAGRLGVQRFLIADQNLEYQQNLPQVTHGKLVKGQTEIVRLEAEDVVAFKRRKYQ